jgi:hypothetical protein
MGNTNVITLEEGRSMLARKRGNRLVFDTERDRIIYPHQSLEERMAHDLHMTKPPAPSISHLGGFLVMPEDEVPPFISC